MKRKFFSILFALVLSFSLMTAMPAVAATINVHPGDSIQDAIDDPDLYDTILVYHGTYPEEVEITRSLTLKGIGYPTIEAPFGENVNAIWIGASDVTVTGFRLKAGDDIVDINPYNLPEGERIEKVVIERNYVTPTQDPFDPNAPGIFACRVDGLKVLHNTIRNTGGMGIFLGLPPWSNADVINSLIGGNRVLNSGYTGICVVWGSNNTIRRNLIRSAGSSVLDDGIRLGLLATDNTIERNKVFDSSRDGIRAQSPTSGNTIQKNVSLRNAEFDCHDLSTGEGTADTANWWIKNTFRTAEPSDLE